MTDRLGANLPRSSRRRSPRLVVAVALLAAVACGARDAPEAEGALSTLDTRLAAFADALGPPPPPGLECRREGFPCSWGEAPAEVLQASVELGEAALARVQQGGTLDGVAEWIRRDPRADQATASDRALAFRLEGGRRVWVLPADTLGLRGFGGPRDAIRTPPGSDRFSLGARGDSPSPSLRAPEVLGEDTDGNGRTNQRDRGRALVLDPFYWEFSLADPEYAEGATVAAILERSDLYDVDLRIDAGAGVDAFRGWEDYDVIHVGTDGSWRSLMTREVLDVSNLDALARERTRSELTTIGVDLALVGVKKGKEGKNVGEKAGEGAGPTGEGAGGTEEDVEKGSRRIGFTAAPNPSPDYPPAPTVRVERVTEAFVTGTAEGPFWQVLPEYDRNRRGTLRVRFRARACRAGSGAAFARCQMIQNPSR